MSSWPTSAASRRPSTLRPGTGPYPGIASGSAPEPARQGIEPLDPSAPRIHDRMYRRNLERLHVARLDFGSVRRRREKDVDREPSARDRVKEVIPPAVIAHPEVRREPGQRLPFFRSDGVGDR